MALHCPIGFDTQQLRHAVSAMYARVAADPGGDYHFHRGARYATNVLGYDAQELARLPIDSTASFAGVGNPLGLGELHPGSTVLDIGCGAGTDLLLAAQRVGPTGRAIGVDMTADMLARTRASATTMGLTNVDLRAGDAESLPVDTASVDVVISNGVLNLTTDKTQAFAEIARVVSPGGRLLLADIVVENELSEGIRNDIDLWAS
jgi:SAM-dependent methyltransferase